jgi:hypothetical protein
MLRQQKKTAEEAIAQGNRLTAGLHVAAGNYCLGPNCLKHIQDKIRKEEERKHQSAIRSKEEYDKILAEVEAIKLLNKTLDQWSVSQLRTMEKCYKRDELDKAMPNKKADLLTRYHETCHHGDRTAPTLPPPLPPQDGPQLKDVPPITDNEEDQLLLDPFLPQANETADDEVDEEIILLPV